MIDRVTLKKENLRLLPKQLDERVWIKKLIVDKETGELIKTLYIKNLNNVRLYFHVKSVPIKDLSDDFSEILRLQKIYNSEFAEIGNLYITGRFINLSIVKNKVTNLDDLWIGAEAHLRQEFIEELTDKEMHEQAVYDENDKLVFPDREQTSVFEEFIEQDLDSLIKGINFQLYSLTSAKLDIRSFKVTYIEFCVNLYVDSQDYVEKFITLFNRIFLYKNDERYSSFVYEKKRHEHTSFYVKPRNQFSKGLNQSYTVNFYNKLDELEYQKSTQSIRQT